MAHIGGYLCTEFGPTPSRTVVCSRLAPTFVCGDRRRRTLTNRSLWLSAWPAAMGHAGYMVLRRFRGNVDPARIPLTSDLRADEAVEGLLAGSVVAMAHDRAVDLTGDNEQERAWRRLERHLDAGSVEQAEGYIQRLPEASVGVIVDLSLVRDHADPQLALRREADVVAGQEPAENGDHPVHQQRPGRLAYLVDEREEAIATVDELVALARVDSRSAQRRVEQLVEHGPEFGFHRIGG